MEDLLGKKIKYVSGKCETFSLYKEARVLALGKKYPDNILITNPEVFTQEDYLSDKLKWTTWIDTKEVDFYVVEE